MVRKIIKIDSQLCNGCELCVNACHEGAIGMREGKAVLLRDDYCDGLGDCLPVCPTGAISFEEREALAYDDEAVKANMQAKKAQSMPCGCPSSNIRTFAPQQEPVEAQKPQSFSRISHWPVQIKLVPTNAPYFDNANLLISADCSAYAYANFHEEFIKNHVTLVGCPKLDEGDYAEKLGEIIKKNNIKSLKVVRMEVPCCGGLENAVKRALMSAGKLIPWQVKTLSLDGKILP